MVILGIDPGTKRIGYGIIEKKEGEILFLETGILKISRGENHLLNLKNHLLNLIRKFNPKVVSIEKIYFVRNQKTGIDVAQARGVVLLTALENGIQIKEYAPNEVKRLLTGYGLADKKSVFKMVKLILKKPDLKIIDDASDALALAIIAASPKI